MKNKIRVHKVRLPGGQYHGLWCAAHGKSFRPFAYSTSLDKLMDRVCARLKARHDKTRAIEAARQERLRDRPERNPDTCRLIRSH